MDTPHTIYPVEEEAEPAEILRRYRAEAEEKEKATLSQFASLSSEHSRKDGKEDDHRMPYKRDVDRIIHSKAYSRYVDKTQVVYLVSNDHVTHRALHVQLVSSFARGIAEILRLNLDLVEAIALGHDVGHPPFGHEGEHYLSALSQEYGNGPFAHPHQSCRLFQFIEPLNLCLNVYDGFLTHDGGMRTPHLTPKRGKNWETHWEEQVMKKKDPDCDLSPGTLEGCLVKMCDTMSYLGRDIEDAISLGILARSEVPETLLGRTNREILRIVARDIIKMSHGKDVIALSDEVFHALKELRKFNFESIYTHPRLKVESRKVERSYRILFQTLLQGYEQKGKESYLYTHYLHNKRPEYLNETTPVQKVVDFISGMTDSYFVRTLNQLIIPKQIELG